jgi:hypothetical protein
MIFSQELQFIIQSLVASLPLLLACFGLLVLAFVRRKEARVPANYAIAGIVLITVVQLIRVIVMPNLPRFISMVIPSGVAVGGLLTFVNFAFNSVFALGILILGAAVFMDRRK